MESLRKDIGFVLTIRTLRAFGFGYLGVLLALYLPRFGLGAVGIGLYLSLATLSGIALNILFLRIMDTVGRRRVMTVAAALYAVAGVLLMVANGPLVLVLAALAGSIPPGGDGLFSAAEQAMIGSVSQSARPALFGRYGLLGSAASAVGLLAAGLPALITHPGFGVMSAYRLMMALYAAIGLCVLLLVLLLSPAVEHGRGAARSADPAVKGPSRVGLGRSHGIMMRMAGLFVADSFGSALITTSLLAYWLSIRFGLGASTLALLFFGIRVLSTASYPLAIILSKRIGLINTAVYTHIPSSMLLMAVPFVPGVGWVAALLLVRGLLVEMDVPTRQAYISAVVDPEERAAAAGVTTIGRQVGQLAGPALGGFVLATVSSVTFVAAGAIKIAYDLALWVSFRHIREDDRTAQAASSH